MTTTNCIAPGEGSSGGFSLLQSRTECKPKTSTTSTSSRRGVYLSFASSRRNSPTPARARQNETMAFELGPEQRIITSARARGPESVPPVGVLLSERQAAPSSSTTKTRPRPTARRCNPNHNKMLLGALQAHTTTTKTTMMKTPRRPRTCSSQAGQQLLTRFSLPCCSLASLLCLLLAANSLLALVAEAIRLQPEGKEKFYWSGEQFVITCQNNNNIKNVKIRWIGPDGGFITENRSARIHAESSGPHGHRLVVMNATLGRDEGVYNCTIGSADNRTPLETAQFALRLLRETNFKDTAKHLTLTAGQRGHIDCAVEFDPSVTTGTVTWFKNQQPIDALSDNSIQVIEYNPDRQLSQLILSPVKREHEDEYTCQAVAITPHLSRIIDYKIKVETYFAPIFDSSEQTIWVESPQALAARLMMGGATLHPQIGQQQSQAQQQQQTTVAHRNIFGANSQRGRSGRPRMQQQQQQQEGGPDQMAQGGNNEQQVIRVELRCTCQANPEANIIWTTRSLKGMVVSKGQPAHVVEEPSHERSGHNTTSVLTVAYNLDPNWEFKRDSYICSASNKLDEAKKVFTIEQGNPPPAFMVGPHKSYNPETAMFAFTLLGPAVGQDPSQQQATEVVPPVDSFRIRAELGSALTALGGASNVHPMPPVGPPTPLAESRSSYLKRQSEPNVQWAYKPQLTASGSYRPQNITVNLGKLPSGTQRLFLEAHNAVGWSPNSTHLGEFYLVSGAHSTSGFLLMATTSQNLLILLACQVVAASYLVASAFLDHDIIYNNHNRNHRLLLGQ